MSRTVQSNIISLLQRIDPTLKDGTTVIAAGNIATWASTAGAKFNPQQVVDFYNEGRTALANAVDLHYPEPLKGTVLGGLAQLNASLTFTSGAAPKPTGFIKSVFLSDVNNAQITINPIIMIPRLKDLETSTNRMVFDCGSSFSALTGTTNIPNAATYKLSYYGITTFVLSDVTGGATVEQFNDDWFPKIIQLAEAVANEQGQQAVNALAAQLVQGMLK